MGKRFKIPGSKKNGVLAKMTDTERDKMATLQYDWEEKVTAAQAADISLTTYRQYIRQKYNLPRDFTIHIPTGVIEEVQEETQPQPAPVEA